MERKKLTTSYIKSLNHTPEKMVRYWDIDLKGFLLQISAKGTMSFYLRYSIHGKKKTYKIGNYPDITATQARNIAQEKAGEIAKSIDIQSVKKAQKHIAKIKDNTIFSKFIDNIYSDHLLTEKKTGKKMLQAIKTHFSQWNSRQLTDINVFLVTNWRKQQLKKGRTHGAVNRPIAYLRALLNHAYKTDIIDTHPLAKFKQLKEDKNKVVRYLDESESKRLRKALIDRDKKAQLERVSSNQWRQDRGYDLLPEIPVNSFKNHLTPIVLLDLNTGMRRSEVFDLKWKDIDFSAKTLAVNGTEDNENGGSKSGNTRIIPLNDEAIEVLTKWKKQTASELFVFTNKNGGKLTDIKKSFKAILKTAKISNFRFHDIRHDFASQLVMKGVDLNTVRELLGHSDLQMTMRYAHLSPNHKSKAVSLLNN